MPRIHSHAGRLAPQCPMSKTECDARWTQFQHGHLGTPCDKQVQESKTRRGQSNEKATCTLRVTPKGLSFAGEVAFQEAGGRPEDAQHDA